MTNRFYMLCLRETVGTNASFHGIKGHGYSTNIDKAETYTLEQAQAFWNTGRNIDLPVSAGAVDELAVYHVDHQNIPGKTTIVEGCDRYVGFVEGRWDGNDLYWLCNGRLPDTDFNEATVFDRPTGGRGIVWLPHDVVDVWKRRTFNINLLDRRKMIQSAGLRMPAHVKRQRQRDRRPATGRVRWNCPVCGKISWQFSPYDFEGCPDRSCEGYAA